MNYKVNYNVNSNKMVLIAFHDFFSAIEIFIQFLLSPSEQIHILFNKV